MRYTDQTRVEAYLNRELTDNEATLVDDTIEYISKLINSYCNRSWFSVRDEEGDGEEGEVYAEEAFTKLFSGNGLREIIIDEFIDLEKIEILSNYDGSVFNSFEAETDFQALPGNETTKQSIRLRYSRFPKGIDNIQITAKWGSGSCPKAVTMVATILVGKFFKKAETNSSTFKKESIEGYSYELQSNADHDSEIKNALSTLDMYKRIVL